jgi:DNA primase
MDEVAEIKARLEITEVVGAYLPLKQAGRNLKAPCPFHQEKTASFMVSPDKGIYHCFGCSEGGDIFNFVMKMEGLDFRQAMEMLARKAGVELKARPGENRGAKQLSARLMEAHELAVRYYQASLVQNQKALEYVIKKRHLAKETVRAFQIGYAPDSWNALTDFLVKRGFSPKELLQGGLAGQKEGRSTVYDLFRGRVMFTICDREGRPVGFTGRVLDDSVPKYLNTPQTPLYDKSQVIFGLHLAKEAIRQADEVVLVEGQMDVVASHQAGVKQVVATSGTALTMEHLRALSKLTKNVKLAFDADRAGLAATERAIEMGQKLGLVLRMVVLPDGVKDADELVQQDVEAWRQAIAGSQYIVDYLFERFERDFDLNSAIGKRGYADRLASALRRLGDPVEQDHYVKLLADKAGVSEEAVRAKLGDTAAPSGDSLAPSARPALRTVGATEPVRRAVVQAEGRPSMQMQQEEHLLGLALKYPAARASVSDFEPAVFSSEKRRQIFEAIRAQPAASTEQLIEGLGEAGIYAKGLVFVVEERYGDMREDDLALQPFELAEVVKRNHRTHLMAVISSQLREAEAAHDEAKASVLRDEFQRVLEGGI